MLFSQVCNSWSLEFVLRHRRYMSLPSAVRYRNVLARQRRNRASANRLMRLRMRSPFAGNVWLREVGSDEDTFKEIAIKQVYGRLLRIPSCEYIVDLGANIGLATRLFAAAYPAASILSVEPDGQNVAILNRNVADLVAAKRCCVLRAALWETDRPVNLGSPPAGTGFNAIRVTPASAPSQVVDGLTISSLLRESGFPRIDLLKVDVEGAEAVLFRNGMEWIRNIGTIAIEFHDNTRAESGFDAVMAAHGFHVDDANPHTVIATQA